jgi:predicted peptidase
MEHLIHKTIQYNLSRPVGFDPHRKYPLVIYVHGAGGRGHDPANIGYSYMLERYMEDHELAVMVAAPLCEFDNWYMCFTELVDFIRFAATMDNVDSERVYIMGASMGGYATWALLMCVPELIAAAVPMCGGGMAWNAGRIQSVPVWAFHGEDDPVVLPCESQNMVNALRACGGDVRLTMLPGVGHNAWEPALYEFGAVEWLLRHRLESSSDAN